MGNAQHMVAPNAVNFNTGGIQVTIVAVFAILVVGCGGHAVVNYFARAFQAFLFAAVVAAAVLRFVPQVGECVQQLLAPAADPGSIPEPAVAIEEAPIVRPPRRFCGLNCYTGHGGTNMPKCKVDHDKEARARGFLSVEEATALCRQTTGAVGFTYEPKTGFVWLLSHVEPGRGVSCSRFDVYMLED